MRKLREYGFAVLVVCVVLMSFMAVPAHAENAGWYLNFGAGVNLMSQEYEADPGLRLSLAGGYNFSNVWGVELETGFLYNSFGPEGHRNSEYAVQMPVLVNLVYSFKTDSDWKPYLGFGVGGALLFDQTDETGFDLVYQPKIGLRRMIYETVSIGASYRYLGFVAQSAFTDSLMGNHSIMIELNKTF